MGGAHWSRSDSQIGRHRHTDSRQPEHRDCQGIREEMDHGSDIPMDADISALVTAGQEGERSHGKQRGNKIVLRAPSIQLSKDYCCGITLRLTFLV